MKRYLFSAAILKSNKTQVHSSVYSEAEMLVSDYSNRLPKKLYQSKVIVENAINQIFFKDEFTSIITITRIV